MHEMTFATCDLCDANEEKLADGRIAVLPPVFLSYGSVARFFGLASTLKVFEDNALVRKALERQGNGAVLVVDGGGSLRCALVGGNLGKLGQSNGWAGIVVHGCIRDGDEIDACNIGVRALGAHPRRSNRKGNGECDIPVSIAGVIVRPGDYIYADRDGLLVSQESLL